MGSRLEFHLVLSSFADHVYFQPPTNTGLEYPCIVYRRDFADTKFADNSPYAHKIRYMVTVIDPDPDSDIPAKVAWMPLSTFSRFYTADNLNHDVFSVYF